jgi:hypothetical protein
MTERRDFFHSSCVTFVFLQMLAGAVGILWLEFGLWVRGQRLGNRLAEESKILSEAGKAPDTGPMLHATGIMEAVHRSVLSVGWRHLVA